MLLAPRETNTYWLSALSSVVCDLTDFHVTSKETAARATKTARSTVSSFTSFLDACKKHRTRDDFSSFSSRRLFDCFTTGSRARSATRAPITWTCSTSAASCPSSRAACARPPRPCGAPCLAARANRKGKDRVGGERKKRKGVRRADGCLRRERRERTPRAPAAASNPRSRST